jgi:hypothetical protein
MKRVSNISQIHAAIRHLDVHQKINMRVDFLSMNKMGFEMYVTTEAILWFKSCEPFNDEKY